jgi:type IV secretory pathway VirB10-like protein
MVCPICTVAFTGVRARGTGCEPEPEDEPEPDPDPDPDPDEEPAPEPPEPGLEAAVEVELEVSIFASEEHPRQSVRKKSRMAATSMVRENSALDQEMGSAEVLGSAASMKALE